MAAAPDEPRPAAALPSALASLDAIVRTLAGRPVALFLDFDGTLAEIVDDHRDAALEPAMRQALARALARVPLIVVSGRSRADVRARICLDGPTYVGEHGLDAEGALAPPNDIGADHAAALGRARAAVARAIAGMAGATIEDKARSFVVHYRLAAAPARARTKAAVRAAVAAEPALRVRAGKQVREIGPNVDWDKGRAVAQTLASLESDGRAWAAVYVGDDVTDEDAFRAIKGRGVSVHVAGRRGEAPPATAADYALAGPAEVRAFLDALTTRL